jgi:hypothetical protein
MYRITNTYVDVQGRAVRIVAEDIETKATSEVVISAEFVFKAKDDIAKEFADFMAKKGYDLKTGKT